MRIAKHCASFAGALAAALVVAAAAAEELRVAVGAEATSVDPHYHNLNPNNQIAYHVFDRLVHQDEKQRLIPGLAQSWKAVDDLTWEFKLRSGVKFHNGAPFTADDVIFTLERAPNVPNSPSSFATYIKGKSASKVDDHTVRIKTDQPNPLVPTDISQVAIVSAKIGKGATTEDYNSGKAAVGTGPYRFAEYVPGDRIVLARNDGYWGAKPAWTKVVFKPIKSDPARVAALLAGDVDLIENVPTTDVAQLRKNDKVSLSEGISNRVIYLHLDHFRDASPFIKGKDGGAIKNPLRDRRVRTALSKAINRPAIVDRVMEQLAIPAGQLLPDGFFGVSDKLQPEKHDPAAAKALLAEAGFPQGFKMTIHGPNDRYVNDAKIVEAVAQMLTRVGIEASVETMPSSVFFRRSSSGGAGGDPEFSFILVGWGAGTGEASSPLRALIHTYDKAKGTGASNRGRYSNPEVDKLIQQALATVDDAKRQALLARATEMAIEDGAIIPLHYQVNVWGAKKGLRYAPRTDEYTLAMSAVKG
jgi:peptide/nickel transport system substrate-binding protein